MGAARPQSEGAPLQLDAFLSMYPLDERATAALQGLSPDEQSTVMRLMHTQQCRNPSAMCWSMIKMVRDNPQQAAVWLTENENGMPRGSLSDGGGVNQFFSPMLRAGLI